VGGKRRAEQRSTPTGNRKRGHKAADVNLKDTEILGRNSSPEIAIGYFDDLHGIHSELEKLGMSLLVLDQIVHTVGLLEFKNLSQRGRSILSTGTGTN
jgi:hypothetical protein